MNSLSALFAHAALVVIACCALCGCAPLVFTAGAGAGYVATQEKPRSTIAAFFEDLGQSIRQSSRKITGEPAGRRTSSGTTAGLSLTILRSSLAPVKVNKGEQVTLTLVYRINGGPKEGVTVRERSGLVSAGEELAVLRDNSSSKENGTWENTLSFTVPESAKPGKYTATMQVSAQGQERSARRTFTVQ